jgi:nicotinamidase-related amidase
LIGNLVAQIGQSSGDPVITPGPVLLAHANDQVFDVFDDWRPAWASTAMRPIEFASDKPSVPPQEVSGRAEVATSPRALRPQPSCWPTPLAALCPPATVMDKTRYSALAEPGLLAHLREREADALIVSGSETDVCLLATVLNAVDIGYWVIVVRDVVCSPSDEGHDMFMRLYHTRYEEQIETADAAVVLVRWE